MWNIDREKAKALGYSDEEINSYLEGLNKQSDDSTQEKSFSPEIESQINKVPEGNRDNMRQVASALKDEGILDANTLAYTLGTIKHETAGTFSPIEEYGGRQQAIDLGYDGGENYYGRGYIQLTHKSNYDAIGKRIGVPDLADNPQKALDPIIAAKIAAAFIKDRGVADAAKKGDFIAARAPINGTDQADTIANYANDFLPTQEAPAQSAPVTIPTPMTKPVEVKPFSPIDPALKGDENVVSPLLGNAPMEVTQPFNNYNPGMGYYDNLHKGTDIGATEGQRITNPVGGTVVEAGYDPAYGNTMLIAGENPQERAARSGNAAQNDWSGYTTDEDAVRISHMQNPAPYSMGDYVATGSAQLNAGSTGKSTGTHLDLESFNLGDYGKYDKYSSFLSKYPEFKQILATYR